MIFADDVKQRYRDAIEEAAAVILEKGNKQHRHTARLIIESDVLIRFVPLSQIGVSGITGLIDSGRTNRRIRNEHLTVTDAMAEVHITFSDWTYDVAGQRGCQGTLVHEGLHACDFGKIISSFSREDVAPDDVFDLPLYDLEHRAAMASADYLVRIGRDDFIDDGLKLNLVGLDRDGKPFVDIEGIKLRMQNGYGLSEDNRGAMISRMLGLKRRSEGFSLAGIFGLGGR